MRFAQAVIPNNPIVIRLRREEQSLDNIKQYFIECADAEGKFQALSNIYGSISIGQSMIFCAVSSLFVHSSIVYSLFNASMHVVFSDEFRHTFTINCKKWWFVVFFINFIDLPSILHIRIYDLFIPTLLTDQTSLMWVTLHVIDRLDEQLLGWQRRWQRKVTQLGSWVEICP